MEGRAAAHVDDLAQMKEKKERLLLGARKLKGMS
jgi:hypothetical protein